MDIATLVLQEAFGSSIYFKCPRCHTKTLIADYRDFYAKGCEFRCPICDYQNITTDSIPNMSNSSIRTDAVDKIVPHNDAEEIFVQSLACGSLGWMFGFVDGGGERYDSALSTIEQARQDAIADIENAWKNPQSGSESRADTDTIHTDNHEGLSAIKKAQREAIAEIEGAWRR